MHASIWFQLPWISEAEGSKFQALLENHVQQNDRSYILDFLSNLPNVQMYISEHHIENKEPSA